MQTIMNSGRKSRKSPKAAVNQSLLRNSREPIIGAHADYSRNDYIFPRQQSLAMREMEWEGRLKPLRSWGGNVVANLAWAILA